MKILLRGGPKDGQVKDEPEVDFDHEEVDCKECEEAGREPKVLKKLTLDESYAMLKEFYLGDYKKTELLVDFACYDYVSDMRCSTCDQPAASNEKCGNCLAIEQGFSRYITSSKGMIFAITTIRQSVEPIKPQEFKASAALQTVESQSLDGLALKVYDVASLLEVHEAEEVFVYELRRDGYTPIQKRTTASTAANPLFVVLNRPTEGIEIEEPFTDFQAAEARAKECDQMRYVTTQELQTKSFQQLREEYPHVVADSLDELREHPRE